MYKVNINDNIWLLKDSIKNVQNYYEENRVNGKIDDNNIEKLFPILSKNITEEDVKKNFISIANELLRYTIKLVYEYSSVKQYNNIKNGLAKQWGDFITFYKECYSNMINNNSCKNVKLLITNELFYKEFKDLLKIIPVTQSDIAFFESIEEGGGILKYNLNNMNNNNPNYNNNQNYMNNNNQNNMNMLNNN